MPNATRTIDVTPADLESAGVRIRPADGPLRILVRYEIDELTGQNAVGYYVEAITGGRWRRVSDGLADDAEEAEEHIRRIEALAMRLDAGLPAWIGEFDAREDGP